MQLRVRNLNSGAIFITATILLGSPRSPTRGVHNALVIKALDVYCHLNHRCV